MEMPVDPELRAMIGELDLDAMDAAVDLIGRTGALGTDFGFTDDDAPTMEEAKWWAYAQYKGGRIMVENHSGPVQALEALARRLLTSARCTWCNSVISLSDAGAVIYPNARMLTVGEMRPGAATADGADLTTQAWTPEAAAKAGICRYRRVGARWVRGCEGKEQKPEPTSARPPRAHPTPQSAHRPQKRKRNKRKRNRR